MMNVPKLEDLGERKAVESLIRLLGPAGTPVGVGDDCAVLDFLQDLVLLTTDMIHEKTHLPSGFTPYLAGWYAAAVNLSDIAAMGGEPLALLAAVSLPREKEENFLLEIMRGMKECGALYNVSVIGGDTKESDLLVIAATAVGRASKGAILLRSGAKAGDVVCLTGTVGRAAVHLERSQEGHSENVEPLLRIYPRITEGRLLSENQWGNSAIDLSDGLALSLHQLARASRVGFEIEGSKVPLFRREGESYQEALQRGLYTGGDFELLFTMGTEHLLAAQEGFRAKGTSFTVIGSVLSEPALLVKIDAETIPLEEKGWEHFKE